VISTQKAACESDFGFNSCELLLFIDNLLATLFCELNKDVSSILKQSLLNTI
jgi:hypothetical protein